MVYSGVMIWMDQSRAEGVHQCWLGESLRCQYEELRDAPVGIRVPAGF